MCIDIKMITGEHCMTPAVKEGLDSLYNSLEYQNMYSPAYMDFSSYVAVDTWKEENFVVYNQDVPVAVFSPKFDRTNNIVSALCPKVFLPHQKMGYGTYIFKWCIKRYFEDKNFHKICTTVWSNNLASLVLNRKFLKEEAVRKKHILVNGVYHDTHLFGLLYSDYEKQKLFDIFSGS